jgi:hypothetical protein
MSDGLWHGDGTLDHEECIAIKSIVFSPMGSPWCVERATFVVEETSLRMLEP